MAAHLRVEQRQLALRLRAKGLSLREIGRQVGCSHEVVRHVGRARSRRYPLSESWRPGPGRLTLADREDISIGVHRGESFAAIASRLGKAPSTVSPEVAGNRGQGQYRAWRAHQPARALARRPKTPKLTVALPNCSHQEIKAPRKRGAGPAALGLRAAQAPASAGAPGHCCAETLLILRASGGSARASRMAAGAM